MSEQLDRSLVRIYNLNQKVVGAGFFVSQKYLITCAHVINQALGVSDQRDLSESEISFDFPRLLPGKICKALVILWKPQPHDIAGLKVLNTSPYQVKTPLISKDKHLDLWEHSFRCFGFPTNHDEGVWVVGTIRGSQANGHIQLESTSEYRIQSGFSGTPVWDDQAQSVVGIVVAAENPQSQAKAAVMMPFSLILTEWDDMREVSLTESYTQLGSPHLADTYEFQNIEPFAEEDFAKFADLIKRSGRANPEARRAFCLVLGIDPGDLAFTANTGDRDFSLQLVAYLYGTGNFFALLNACQEIEKYLYNNFKEQLHIIQNALIMSQRKYHAQDSQ